MLSRFILFTTLFTALISPDYPVSNMRRKQAEIWLLVLRTKGIWGIIRTKPFGFFLRIGWAAGAECAPAERIQNASKGVACLAVTAQHALRLPEARSFSASGRRGFPAHGNLLPAQLGLTDGPPG